MADDKESLLAKIADLERRNAELEQQLRAKNAMYNGLVEDQRELICRYNHDGTISFANDAYCRYFDKTREELVGHHFAPLVPEEDHPIVADVMARLGPNEPVVGAEHRVMKPSGDVRWLNWVDRAIFDEAGSVVAFQAVGIDVTDRVHAEEQTRKNEALREQLIAAQEQALRELSAPLIPIADDVLALPLVGRIDEKRAQLVLETVLNGVVATSAETVLIDVTGITTIDEHVAAALVRTAQAVKLLGARAILTGIRPHVAQMLVTMGIEVHGVTTLRSLKEGIAWSIKSRDPGRHAKGPGRQSNE